MRLSARVSVTGSEAVVPGEPEGADVALVPDGVADLLGVAVRLTGAEWPGVAELPGVFEPLAGSPLGVGESEELGVRESEELAEGEALAVVGA